MIKLLLGLIVLVTLDWLGFFLCGWWILNHKQPTDLWKDRDDG